MPSCTVVTDPTDLESLADDLNLMVPGIDGVATKFLKRAATEFFRQSTRWRVSLDVPATTLDTDLPLPTVTDATVTRIMDVFYDPQETISDDELRMPERREIYRISGNTVRYDEDQYWYSNVPTAFELNQSVEHDQTLRVSVALIPSGQIAPGDLIQRYRESLIAGARHYAHSVGGKKSYSNPHEARRQGEKFIAGIHEAQRWHTSNVHRGRPASSRRQTLREISGTRRYRARDSNYQ